MSPMLIKSMVCVSVCVRVSLEVARVDVHRSSSLDTEQSLHVLLIKKREREKRLPF